MCVNVSKGVRSGQLRAPAMTLVLPIQRKYSLIALVIVSKKNHYISLEKTSNSIQDIEITNLYIGINALDKDEDKHLTVCQKGCVVI